MANITITDVDYGSIMLGGEEFEDGILAAAAGGVVPQGTVLEKSGTDWVFGSATPTAGAALGVLTYDVDIAAAGDIPIRVLITGRVDRTRLLLNGSTNPVPQAVVDALRNFSIIALDVDHLGSYDNPNNP